MKTTKQVTLGVLTGAIAIAAAVTIAALTGLHTANGAAATANNAPAPVPIPAGGPNVAAGFGALGSTRLSTPPGRVIAELQSMHPGSYTSARQVATGMFIADNNGSVCMWVDGGEGGCTDRLNAPDAWLSGDMTRESDSATAPFQVHLYGIARNSVASFSFTLANGNTINAPVSTNAFSVTIPDTAFADIESIAETYTNGGSVTLDPGAYYPKVIPTVKP